MQRKQQKKPTKRRTFIMGCLTTTVGIGVVGTSALYYSREIEPSWLDITHLPLHLPRLTPAFHGYRLVQISDIHTDDTWMTAERVAGLVRMVNNLQPDLTVITGDFVTHYLRSSAQAMEPLSALRARDGVFGILGNHDHASGAQRIRTLLRAYHIQELNNEVHTVRRGDQMLHIVGMDDLWPMNLGRPKPVWTHLQLLQQLTTSLPGAGAAILLVHEPDFADVTASVGRYDLQLSGHSHGGQVRIPLHGALALPPLSRKYPCGLYQIKDLQHYTNRGLGMIEPQVRLNCRPEISVFELQK